MEELDELMRSFLTAVGSRSDLPGINDINLATAAVALLRAEEVAPGSEEASHMRAIFLQLDRKGVYEAVRRAMGDPQP